jgi:PAS domain S-box-containing protein
VKTTYDVLQWVQLAVFGILGVVATAQWLKRRNEATAWLAATFGVLAVVVVVGRLIPQDSNSAVVDWVVKIEIAVLVLFPYFLYRFMGSLIGRPKRWIYWLATGLTAAVIVFTFTLSSFPDQGEPRTPAVQAFIFLLIAQWVFLLTIVAARLWRGGRDQPTVTRRRMKTMSLGSIGLAIALILAGFAPADQRVNVLQIAISLLGIASGPLFLLGFATPAFVRASWRKTEEQKFREAELGLMEALRPAQVAEALLPHVSELIGGRSILLDKDGEPLGIYDLEPHEAAGLAAEIKGTASTVEQQSAEGAILSVPMKSGWLAVQASPFTPFFGRDESEMLHNLALLTDLALGRIELSQREARLQEQLLEAQSIARIGSWEWNLQTDERTWSDEMYRIYGLDPATFDPTTGNAAQWVHPDDRARVQEVTERAVAEKQSFSNEFRVVTPAGEPVVVFARGKMVIDASGEPVKVIGTVQDITARKRQETLRDQFIANAAHELRTPMTTLLGLTNMLATNRDRLNEAQVDEAYDVVVRAGDRLTALINNLLDLTKLQQGAIALHLEPVPIAQVSREIVEATPPPEGVSVEVEIPEDLVGVTDPERFDQVVSNLLTNAYRYGGPEIVVKGEAKNGSVLVSISDNGPGVDEKLIPRMFDPFARGQGSGEVGGSGLGLAIVKMLVEASNGEIWYENNGRGARFTIRLQKS